MGETCRIVPDSQLGSTQSVYIGLPACCSTLWQRAPTLRSTGTVAEWMLLQAPCCPCVAVMALHSTGMFADTVRHREGEMWECRAVVRGVLMLGSVYHRYNL